MIAPTMAAMLDEVVGVVVSQNICDVLLVVLVSLLLVTLFR